MNLLTDKKIRIVTAASLFDGHDAAINIMRRILQSKGAEIIHLGHNRSVAEIVECAIEEDADGIAITSYQGGHVEFFKYMKDLLQENGSGHIKLFGGGGGTILPSEIAELHDYGITRIYSPDDGRKMGLEGMIQDLLDQAATSKDTQKVISNGHFALNENKDIIGIATAITKAENEENIEDDIKSLKDKNPTTRLAPVLGITGTGGAGKSSVTDEIVRRFLSSYEDKTIAVISVDPSKKKTGGALLGDRIRMNAIASPRAYMRSLATRENDKALSKFVEEAIEICRAAAFDLIILESAGVGQSDASILDFSDVSMYVMTPEYGAPSQLEKINMLDYADVICLNKFDKAGALDALHDVRKQYKRNHGLWDAKDEDLPIVGSIAAQFNDAGVNELFVKIIDALNKKMGTDFSPFQSTATSTSEGSIIPAKRVRYLAEIAESNTEYDNWVKDQSKIMSTLYQLRGTIELLKSKMKK